MLASVLLLPRAEHLVGWVSASCSPLLLSLKSWTKLGAATVVCPAVCHALSQALNLALCLFLLAQFSGRIQHASRS